MKLKFSFAVALATAALAHVASAQTTVIDVTGATAFRNAAVAAIRNSFTATPEYGFNGTAFGGATFHIFKGTMTGIAGTTIIRTSWNGSTEGARACIFDINNFYLAETTAGLTTTGTSGLSTASLVSANNHDLYFSDTDFSKTVYSTFTLQPAEAAEVSGLTQTSVGAIVFALLKNETNATFSGLTNITEKNFKSLFGTANAGRMRLSQFTGLDADDNAIVYATGRSDLSGTRTSYMLEGGIGPATPITQWKPVSTANNMTSIQLWPVGDNTAPNDNRSIQWTLSDTALPPGYPTAGVEIPGNGGFFSGSVLRDLMDDTSNNLTLLDDGGGVIDTNQNVALVTYLANGDAAAAISNGAVALAWNGVSITPNASGLSAADKAKIQNGLYTAWNFEKFNKTGAAVAAETTAYNAILGQIQGVIGAAGLTNVELTGVDRPEDGGPITIAVP